MSKQIKKRKVLNERCPFCGSSQIYPRKFLKNYKCTGCGKTFKQPKGDE